MKKTKYYKIITTTSLFFFFVIVGVIFPLYEEEYLKSENSDFANTPDYPKTSAGDFGSGGDAPDTIGSALWVGLGAYYTNFLEYSSPDYGEDWIKFYVEAYHSVELDWTCSNQCGNMYVSVYYGGTLIVTVQTTVASELSHYVGTNGGWYYIRIFGVVNSGYPGSISYDFYAMVGSQEDFGGTTDALTPIIP